LKELIKAIEHLKIDKGIDDKQFAKSIELDPGAWSRKKRNITKLTKYDLDMIVIKYPELKEAVCNSIGVVNNI